MQNFGTQWSKSSSESISVCCIRSFGKARELGHLYVCVYRFKCIHIFTYGVGTHHSVGIGFVPNVSIYKMMVLKCRNNQKFAYATTTKWWLVICSGYLYLKGEASRNPRLQNDQLFFYHVILKGIIQNYSVVLKTDRQTDRQIDRQTDR